MENSNNFIPAMRHPTNDECRKLASQWKAGTNAGTLRVFQIVVVILVVMAGSLALSGGQGFSGAMILLIAFLVMMLWLAAMWGKFASKIRSRTEQLEKGSFQLTNADGEKPGTLSTYNFYVGFANAKLPDGTAINGLQMPYKHALQLRRRRIKTFSAYLVHIDGEDKPMIFLRED